MCKCAGGHQQMPLRKPRTPPSLLDRTNLSRCSVSLVPVQTTRQGHWDTVNLGNSNSEPCLLNIGLDGQRPQGQPQGEDRHKCRFCPYSSIYIAHVARHERTHTGEKPFGCPICHKAFSQGANLRVHVRTHTGDKRFRCDICQKAFVLRCTLARHRMIHTGERPYQCSVCGRAFARSGTLSDHEKIHRRMQL
ncbi:zinc finger protein 2-like [Ixodes scapularis]